MVMDFTEEGNIQRRIITAYQPCKGNEESGEKIVYKQQKRILVNRGIEECTIKIV